MKRSNREINIFNMSALDLFASALGAFIVLALVVFPFFPNLTPEKAAERIAELTAQLDECKNERDECIDEARKKFLLIIMTWESTDDVDLYVRDPQGRVYNYEKKTHAGSDAAMEVDNTSGPGNEIWLHPKATPGNYEVCYHYYRKQEPGSVKVRGSYITPVGRNNFEPINLSQQGEIQIVAVITVDGSGNASTQPGSGGCGYSP